jgi:hypothetical protein
VCIVGRYQQTSASSMQTSSGRSSVWMRGHGIVVPNSGREKINSPTNSRRIPNVGLGLLMNFLALVSPLILTSKLPLPFPKVAKHARDETFSELRYIVQGFLQKNATAGQILFMPTSSHPVSLSLEKEKEWRRSSELGFARLRRHSSKYRFFSPILRDRWHPSSSQICPVLLRPKMLWRTAPASSPSSTRTGILATSSSTWNLD